MKPETWPIEPWTTMSTPFIEIPQRAEALPLIDQQPPRPVAPADWLASPSTTTVAGHDVLGHAGPAVALDADGGELVHPGAVVADVPVDLDLGVGVEADGDRVRAVGVGRPASVEPSGLEVVQALVELAHR